MNAVVLGKRVLNQIIRDKGFLFFSLIAPVMIITVLRTFFDTFPDQFPVDEYVIGIAALIVFVITFVLSMISIVEERVNGTLQRMFINGVSKTSIIIGYILGYLAIATIQACIVIGLTLYLFELELDFVTIVSLFGAIWLLAIASVALGLLISSFVRRQVQIIPFIPIVMIPTVFLSGIIVSLEELPLPAQIIGQATPLYYTNNIIDIIYETEWDIYDVLQDLGAMVTVLIVFIVLASLTLRPVE
jgi:ABC-2 type transport system permease protein